MNAERFHWLLQNYTTLLPEESNELISIQNEYPYCQAIHHMLARASQDLQLTDRDLFLHKSAIYATDRAVLKSIMNSAKAIRPVFIESKKNAIDEKTETLQAINLVPSFAGGDLYAEIETDLAQLAASKHRFEELIEKLERSPQMLGSEPVKSQDDKEVELLEEIKNAKKQVKLAPKQKEQIEIIDQFIKIQPTLPKLKQEAGLQDLTEKSDIQNTQLVSETLVEILLKQGKTERAVEMLKKLIWKFPQKKTYFAARIEELKK